MKRYAASFLLSFVLFFVSSAQAFFWDNYLVKINGQTYTKEDFLRWWKFWKEPGMKAPQTPDPFINWLLMAEEAKALGLDQEPSYKHKLKVFLEVRGLLLLKNEEVDSKIDLSRKTLWQEYVKNYVPRLRIKALITKDKKEAEQWRAKIKSPEDFEKLFEKLAPKGKAKDFGWERPVTIPKELQEVVLKAKPGEILGPLYHKKAYFVLYVKEKFGPDEADFKALRRSIAHKLRKKESAKLTSELIKRLKEKYNVKLYKDVVEKVGLKALPENLAKQVVLKIGDEEMTAAQLQEKLKKELNLRFHNKKITKETIEKLKWFIINNSIAQTLTSMEALNRHYENKSPLKELYEFYKKEMLVGELQEKIIWPQVKVTEEEAKKYYEKHIKDFTRPERVEIAVIKTQDPQLIRKVYKRLRRGEDFFEVGKEISFHGVQPERYRMDQLVPEMRKALARMKPGDISSIIKFQRDKTTWYCIVKLLRHYPEAPHPFEMVKNSIIKSLRQKKFEELKAEYIAKLRANSQIKINKRVWQQVRKELEAKNEKRAR